MVDADGGTRGTVRGVRQRLPPAAGRHRRPGPPRSAAAPRAWSTRSSPGCTPPGRSSTTPTAYALRALLDPRPESGSAKPARRPSPFDLVDVEPIEARPDEDIDPSWPAWSPTSARSSYSPATPGCRSPTSPGCWTANRDDVVGPAAVGSPATGGDATAAPSTPARRRARGRRPDGTRRGAVDRRPPRRPRGAVAAPGPPRRGGRGAAGRGRVRCPPGPAAAALRSPRAHRPRARARPRSAVRHLEERCRVRLVSAWRSEMAEVISYHLDPQGSYFTGYSYSYTEDYQGSGSGTAAAPWPWISTGCARVRRRSTCRSPPAGSTRSAAASSPAERARPSGSWTATGSTSPIPSTSRTGSRSSTGRKGPTSSPSWPATRRGQVASCR